MLFRNNTIGGDIIARALSKQSRGGKNYRQVCVKDQYVWVIENPDFADNPPDWLLQRCAALGGDKEDVITILKASHAAWQAFCKAGEYYAPEGTDERGRVWTYAVL